jgi:hypothetical protein
MKEITQYNTLQKYFLDESGFIYGRDGKMKSTTILTINGPKTQTKDKWVCIVYHGAPTDKKFYTYKNYKGELKWSLRQTWKPNSYVPGIDDFRTTYIYYLCDKKDGIPRYVGKTDNPKKRFGSHKRESLDNRRGRHSHKQNWINEVYKNGSSIEMVIIDEVIGDSTPGSGNWPPIETYWGHQLTQWGFPIIFDGGWGSGGNRRKRTQEERENNRHIAADVQGRKCYLYDIYNKTYKTFNANKECCRYLQNIGFWDCDIKTISSDTTISGTFFFSYKVYSWDEIYLHLYERTQWEKKVLQMDINFESIIKEYPSLREAQRQTGVNNVAACLNKTLSVRKSASGFRWIYKLDYIYKGIDKIKKELAYTNKTFQYTNELIDDCLSLSNKEAITKYKGIISHGTIGNIKNNPSFYRERIGQYSTTTVRKKVKN